MQDQQVIRILLVDHHAMVSSGLSALLRAHPDFLVVGQAGTGEEALRLFEHHEPDVVALEVDMPGEIDGMELIRALRRKSAHVRVLVLTNTFEQEIVHQALREGATSYLLKNASAEELVHAIRAAHQSMPTLSPEVTRVLVDELSFHTRLDHGLTAREQEVLELIARGWNNPQIAEALHVSLSTVQFHVSNILAKLDVNNRTEAATFAVQHGLARNRHAGGNETQ
jgi:NarL family two-component system response regulator LiaR